MCVDLFLSKCIDYRDYVALQTVYHINYAFGNLQGMHKCCYYLGIHLEELLSALFFFFFFSAENFYQVCAELSWSTYHHLTATHLHASLTVNNILQ